MFRLAFAFGWEHEAASSQALRKKINHSHIERFFLLSSEIATALWGVIVQGFYTDGKDLSQSSLFVLLGISQ